jgi:hypothetical protein
MDTARWRMDVDDVVRGVSVVESESCGELINFFFAMTARTVTRIFATGVGSYNFFS